jgi:hypothetical protein
MMVAFLLRVILLLVCLGHVFGMRALLYGVDFAAVVGACESWCYIPLNLAFVFILRYLLWGDYTLI